MSNDLAIKIKTNQFFLFVILISLTALTASYSAEFLFQKIPCRLCRLERLPYFGMLVMGSLGFSNFDKKIPLFCLLGICMISLILAAYHYGIQQNIFKDFCKTGSVSSMEDFKNMLHSPACSRIGFSVLGIPATIINFFISLVLIFLAYLRLKTYRKN